MATKYYIAYGSNLNIAQMKWRCPGARVVGTTILNNYRLLFKGSKTGAYLTIEPAEGRSVPVAVWAVTPDNEKALDRYEGYPNFYYKRTVRLVWGDKKRDAFVYIMHEDRPLGQPTPFYVQTCAEGYETFGFDTGILECALRESRKEQSWKCPK